MTCEVCDNGYVRSTLPELRKQQIGNMVFSGKEFIPCKACGSENMRIMVYDPVPLASERRRR